LFITNGRDDREQRAGFATAALLARAQTCWMAAGTRDYRRADWSTWQDVPLGKPNGPARRQENGVWKRDFEGGWVAVNPTTERITMRPPRGLSIPDRTPVEQIDLAPGDSAVLLR
jgi:hypothetical protein